MKRSILIAAAVLLAAAAAYYFLFHQPTSDPAASVSQTAPATAPPPAQLRIVGSSTVFPFATAVAEQFGQKTEFRAPIVESTGTGGGFKAFCSGAGLDTESVVNASRRIKPSELANCRANGVTVTEVKIGADGIAVAGAKAGPDFSLTLQQLFLALAKEIPQDGAAVPNPYTQWSDIDSSLPAIRIEVLGPPPTSGTRDAFVEIAMEEGCKTAYAAAGARIKDGKCRAMREDGAYIEAGENDNLIVRKLEKNPNSIGIFGFSFLDQNTDKMKGIAVGGVAPEFEAIQSGDYPIARSLFFYAKREHRDRVPGLREFILEFTDEGTWGPDGYLADKGLVPLPDDDRAQAAIDAANFAELAEPGA